MLLTEIIRGLLDCALTFLKLVFVNDESSINIGGLQVAWGVGNVIVS